MRKLNIRMKDDTPKGPFVDVLECPMCGRIRESVDIDFKRWRYCHKDKIRWCIADNREFGGGSSMSAERWHAIVDRVYPYRVVEVAESGELKDCAVTEEVAAKPEAEADEEEDATNLLTPVIRSRLPKLWFIREFRDGVVGKDTLSYLEGERAFRIGGCLAKRRHYRPVGRMGRVRDRFR